MTNGEIIQACDKSDNNDCKHCPALTECLIQNEKEYRELWGNPLCLLCYQPMYLRDTVDRLDGSLVEFWDCHKCGAISLEIPIAGVEEDDD